MTIDGSSLAMDYVEIGRLPILGSPSQIMPELGDPGTALGVVGINGPVNIGSVPINVSSPAGVVNLSFNKRTRATNAVLDIVGDGVASAIRINTPRTGIEIASSQRGITINAANLGESINAPRGMNINSSIYGINISAPRGMKIVGLPFLYSTENSVTAEEEEPDYAIDSTGDVYMAGAVAVTGTLTVNGAPVCVEPCGGGGGYVVYPLLTEPVIINRFEPIFWRIDGPRTMSFCVTNYENGFQASFTSKLKGDLAGLLWNSVDRLDHKYCAYGTNTDYRGLVWSFDIEYADTCPVINEETNVATLTIEAIVNDEPITYFIALKNYAGPDTDKPVRKARITIDFDNVKAGFAPDTPVDSSNIQNLFFSCVSSSYVEYSTEPLPAPIPGYIRITNQTIVGVGTQLSSEQAFVAPHEFGMSTSYDDMYDLNPARVIRNCRILGYRGWINHYCGVSHYPNVFWNPQVNRFTNMPAGPVKAVNDETALWHLNYAIEARKAQYKLIYAVSYEYFSEFAYNGENGIPDWIQRDWYGEPGITGYTPPTYFFSLCNTDAIAYLHQVFVEFADIMAAASIEVIMQVGEPWWWYNPFSNLPCVYDYPTRLAFNAATGLFMQDMGTIQEAQSLTQTPFPQMFEFLRTTLGQSVQGCRAAVKTAYPEAQVCPLIFFPTILDKTVGIMSVINYPIEEYSFPNFEFIMTEVYDWINTGQLNLSYLGMQNAIDDFGYPPELIQYLGGFVNREIENVNVRKQLWRYIVGNLKNNIRYGIWKQHIWAYPQVMYDSITIIDQNDTLNFNFGDDQLGVVRQDPEVNILSLDYENLTAEQINLLWPG